MTFIDDNRKERMKFVDIWSKYVLEHSDKEWSSQQNVIINSCLKTANMSKDDFLRMKMDGSSKKVRKPAK
jgi:hypothetical protein